MIDRAGEETKGDELRPAAVLRFLLSLVGVVVITISELLFKSLYSRFLHFAFVDSVEGIDSTGNTFTGGNVLTGVGFFL